MVTLKRMENPKHLQPAFLRPSRHSTDPSVPPAADKQRYENHDARSIDAPPAYQQQPTVRKDSTPSKPSWNPFDVETPSSAETAPKKPERSTRTRTAPSCELRDWSPHPSPREKPPAFVKWMPTGLLLLCLAVAAMVAIVVLGSHSTTDSDKPPSGGSALGPVDGVQAPPVGGSDGEMSRRDAFWEQRNADGGKFGQVGAGGRLTKRQNAGDVDPRTTIVGSPVRQRADLPRQVITPPPPIDPIPPPPPVVPTPPPVILAPPPVVPTMPPRIPPPVPRRVLRTEARPGRRGGGDRPGDDRVPGDDGSGGGSGRQNVPLGVGLGLTALALLLAAMMSAI